MITNISNTNQLTTELKNSSSSTQTATKQTALNSPEVSPATEASAVQISEASRLAQDVQGELASFPEVDAEKVAELKAAIQSGSYEVDSSRLAAKIMMLENMIGDDENGQ